jgi:hypothetical protein
MTSPVVEAAVKQCVVCSRTADSGHTAGGDWLLVFHYAPPHGDHACGHWIHEHCRYRDDAPACPCGSGPAEEGLTRAAVAALHPAPARACDRDESVPTADELAALETDRSFDSDSESEDSDQAAGGADNASDTDGD